MTHTEEATLPSEATLLPREQTETKKCVGIPDLEKASDTGEPVVNGYRLMVVGERALQAAKIDVARWQGTYRNVADWLRSGIEPDAIYAAISKRAAADGYTPPWSLAYFDQIVRVGQSARVA